MKKNNSVDKSFLIVSILLISFGLLIFLSASLSLLSKNQAAYSSILSSQLTLGILLGGIMCIIFSFIPYRIWSYYSFWTYIIAIILISLVFIPGIGYGTKGAHRWIDIGPIAFQPVELMKIAYIFFLSSWFAAVKEKSKEIKKGLLPFLIISLIPTIILLLQPDNDNLLIMILTGFVIYFFAGMKWKHFLVLGVIGVIGITFILLTKPYVLDRVKTFLDPNIDPTNSSYQLKQSTIAIGAGEIKGKGFGQSIQKFEHLPEPISDSIFAVASEEFGFIGSTTLIILYLLFLFFGLKIAIKAKDLFGRYVVLGLVFMIVFQSFINIASMLGIFPLSGLPLIFVSHGGTALFISLCSVGIILNVSKFQKEN